MLKVIMMVAINIVITLAFASAQTVYYNNMRGSPTDSTIFFDGKGMMTGSSLQVGNMVTYHDASGRMVGSSMPTTPLPLERSPLSEHYLDEE
jgi:hypothetical protein